MLTKQALKPTLASDDSELSVPGAGAKRTKATVKVLPCNGHADV